MGAVSPPEPPPVTTLLLRKGTSASPFPPLTSVAPVAITRPETVAVETEMTGAVGVGTINVKDGAPEYPPPLVTVIPVTLPKMG